MIIVKFGGTSVGTAAAIRATAEIVRGRMSRGPVVVVSALSGVTNALLAMAEQAAAGQLILAVQAVEGLRARHFAEAEALLGPGRASEDVCSEMSPLLDDLASLAEALSVLGHLTPRSLDAIAATGEMLSSLLVVAAYGAAAKGNTLLNFCGVTPADISQVADRNPHKQSKFLPGTHIPVVSPEALLQAKPDYVLILPWNLQEEIRQQLQGIKQWGGRFVTPVPVVRIYP